MLIIISYILDIVRSLLLLNPQFFRGSQIFCGSQSASAIRTSPLVTCVNRLYSKYVKPFVVMKI